MPTTCVHAYLLALHGTTHYLYRTVLRTLMPSGTGGPTLGYTLWLEVGDASLMGMLTSTELNTRPGHMLTSHDRTELRASDAMSIPLRVQTTARFTTHFGMP